ncbi:MAG: polysaccharide pyruvyl transferase family protein [Eubacterium sp.]|nr:polysaccharide pyruvyl transferase family protein [Eubacterium sp.]
MKVGIITFHFVSNQGGVLQAYASQTFLEKNGHEAYIIDYRPGYHNVRYAVMKNPFTYSKHYWMKFQNQSFLKRMLLTIRSFARCIYMNLKKTDAGVASEYDNFINKNLHLTRGYKSLRQLESNPPRFDAYVTGSDQLWNPELLDYKFDPAYFLLFGDKNIPKVAYAVSTGKNLSADEESQLKQLASELSAVSMREFYESTVGAIGKYTHICIDPTLLLDATDYSSVESEREEETYIFVYGFETTDDIIQAVDLAVKKYGCRVVNGSPHRVKLNLETTNLRDFGPDRFLTLIKNAQCVVTNSFHGTAFSIIYKKDFVTVAHSTRGRRMIELLGKVNLNQRLWGAEEFSFDKPIDWNSVYNILKVLRKYSGEYLLYAIQGVPGERIPHWDEEYMSINVSDK